MTTRIHCTRQHPARDEVIIPTRRLELLERKERAHDDYLEAIQTVRLMPIRRNEDYHEGYRQAMLDLSQAIVDAQARRMAEAS